MTTLNTLVTQLQTFVGDWGSPVWIIIGIGLVFMFVSRWAVAIRRLLPFLGAATILALLLWAAVNIGWISIHF